MEDDTKLASFVQIGLEKNECTVDLAFDSVIGETLALSKKYDVIILDVIVPGINGFELCRKIRNNNIKTPILMLTSLDSIEDKIAGFESGADDYLLKPFQFQELLVRLRALDRRHKDNMFSSMLTVSDLQIDTITKKVTRGDQEIKLTALEYKILELLVSQKGKVFERIEISEKIWGTSFDSGTNVIDVHINSLRNKIDKNFPQKLIRTIIGMGYALDDLK
jgi:DNA-binding response OmpR family regulator